MDYQASGPFPLKLVRHYNSQADQPGRVGHNWNILPRLITASAAVQAIRPDMKGFQYLLQNGQWQTDADVGAKLVRLTDGAGNPGDWQLTLADGGVETYSASGALTGYRHPTGQAITVTGANASQTRLTDAHGRSLTLDFDSNDTLARLTDPEGRITTYTYDPAGNLSTVTYPDATTKTYHYEDPAHPHALTGITDENGQRYATWSYDAEGRAISSEHAGGAERVDLAFNPDGTTTVTDALGTPRTQGFTTVLGVVKGTGISQPGGAGCGAASSAVSHDAHGNPTTRDDFNGHRTRYWYDQGAIPARNLETTRVEGLAIVNGSEQIQPETRTTTTAWHPDWRLPTEERTYTGGADSNGTPLGTLVKTVTSTYDPQGNLLTRTETDNLRNENRTWTYTYISLGRIASADGPRTDVADITTYTYHPDDDPDPARRGQLWKITNALGHITTYDDYDLHGHVTRTTDPNGLITTYTYDPRGRLTQRTVGTRTTTYTYDAAGNLTGLTQPDGTTTTYSYDAAHRLTGITDPQGNRIAYTLDGLGNPLQETVYDTQGNPVRSLNQQFDALGRLWKEIRSINGQAAVTEYAYDPQGNPTSRTDPLNHTTLARYDALDRLTQQDNAMQRKTQVAHGVTDQITAVTDPKGLKTHYDVDAFGQVRKETSPDRGITTYTYDPAGNLKTRTDARGKTVTYTYDALNRLTRSQRNDGEALYFYDTAANGLGRLAQALTGVANTAWSYDTQGAVTRKQVGESVVTYAHDPAGRLTRLTYPSGTLVEYAYTQGRISRITVNGQVLLDHIGYAPFGPAQTWTWGNGQTYARSYEENGWIKQYPVANLNRTLAYDRAGRITAYRHPGQANFDQTFNYNAIDQLYSTTTYQGSQGYRYDNNGNRTQQLSGSTTYAYGYKTGSNRLQSVAGPVPKAYQYDAAGNITSDGQGLSYSYDDLGRLSGMSQRKQTGDAITIKAMGYTYDGLGQRFMKGGDAAGVIFYAYDETGRLLSEQDVGNVASQDTIWLDDLPVGVVKQGQLHYIHADHLHTPRAILDPQNRPRWRWDNADPFGVGQPDENPSGLGRFVYNPRFPGQVYDAESGLHYNYYRDGYEPRTGRYTQGDPIGLAGGVNVYGYVNGNPTRWVDPLGLDIYTFHVGVSVPLVGGFDVGLLYNTGMGESSYLPDLGVFGTINKNYKGVGRFKTTVGISQTLGGRCNFDGTDAELHLGLGSVGGSLGGFNKRGRPTSLGFDVGPQLGFGADLTQTTSLTVGDLARGLAKLVHGAGGSNSCGCQQ